MTETDSLLGSYRTFGEKPIHFFHIRKTSGTSLNFSFFKAARADPDLIWKSMREDTRTSLDFGPYRFVTRSKNIVESGRYSYSYAHLPPHRLKLPQSVFTVTILRHPVDRIFSYYSTVVDSLRRGERKHRLEMEQKWIGGDVVEFCKRIPANVRNAQLYTFSAEGHVEDALWNLRQISHVLVNEDFETGLHRLSEKIQYPLETFFERRTYIPVMDEDVRKGLESQLRNEIYFYYKCAELFG